MIVGRLIRWSKVVMGGALIFMWLAGLALAQEPSEVQPATEEAQEVAEEVVEVEPAVEEVTPAEEEVVEIAPEALEEGAIEEEAVEAAPGYVTMDFKDADIHNVLRILSYKSGMNIVAGPEVEGKVTVRLVDVPWETALDVILSTYDFGYERVGNIITVTTMEKLTAKKRAAKELAEVQPVVTRVFVLKYLDAGDAKRVLEPQLSPRGKITVLEVRGQKGWVFGAEKFGKRERVAEAEKEAVRSNTMVISDIPPYLEKIEKVIEEIDKKPKQILIETRLVEVSRDRVKDLGLDLGTGSDGWSAIELGPGGGFTQITGESETVAVAPSVLDPSATIAETYPFDAGLTILFQKLTGTQYRMILHALEEDVEANILSAPRIMTLNNQEAAILVGEKYPILKGSVEEGVVTTSLDYYEDIGIQLNVVPQISGEDHINMILHPSVTSWSQYVSAMSDGNEVARYPRIKTREAETQILMKDGEAIVMGGLIKDVKSEAMIGIPILSKIPLLGYLFSRKVVDTEKVDLLIFITAHIVKPGEYLAAEVSKLEEPRLGRERKIEEQKIERIEKRKRKGRGRR